MIMQKLDFLSEEEITEMAEAFAYYEYADGEKGMIPYYPGYPDRTRLINYLKAIIRPAVKAGAAYTTSEKHEGIIILTDTTKPAAGKYVLQMMFGMIKALGLRGFVQVMKHFQSGGESLERKYRKEKKDFVQIELLCVKKKYQGQGFMRPLVEQAFAAADKKGLPVILTTDAELKKDKYAHIGLTLVNIRRIGEGACLYDLVREGRVG